MLTMLLKEAGVVDILDMWKGFEHLILQVRDDPSLIRP
jgi:hypothetical protein